VKNRKTGKVSNFTSPIWGSIATFEKDSEPIAQRDLTEVSVKTGESVESIGTYTSAVRIPVFVIEQRTNGGKTKEEIGELRFLECTYSVWTSLRSAFADPENGLYLDENDGVPSKVLKITRTDSPPYWGISAVDNSPYNGSLKDVFEDVLDELLSGFDELQEAMNTFQPDSAVTRILQVAHNGSGDYSDDDGDSEPATTTTRVQVKPSETSSIRKKLAESAKQAVKTAEEQEEVEEQVDVEEQVEATPVQSDKAEKINKLRARLSK
jgi:hypothetical protein